MTYAGQTTGGIVRTMHASPKCALNGVLASQYPFAVAQFACLLLGAGSSGVVGHSVAVHRSDPPTKLAHLARFMGQDHKTRLVKPKTKRGARIQTKKEPQLVRLLMSLLWTIAGNLTP